MERQDTVKNKDLESEKRRCGVMYNTETKREYPGNIWVQQRQRRNRTP